VNAMDKKNLIIVEERRRTLYYHMLSEPRKDGVVAVLFGYRKQGKDYWFEA
jgi:hypothetical protein